MTGIQSSEKCKPCITGLLRNQPNLKSCIIKIGLFKFQIKLISEHFRPTPQLNYLQATKPKNSEVLSSSFHREWALSTSAGRGDRVQNIQKKSHFDQIKVEKMQIFSTVFFDPLQIFTAKGSSLTSWRRSASWAQTWACSWDSESSSSLSCFIPEQSFYWNKSNIYLLI